MTERRNIADILCIGCQKGSTSWLHSALALHPDTHAFPNSEPTTSTDKEAHFWDWNHHRGVEWYRTLLTPPEPHLRSLDFTPEYAFLPDEKIAECKALNPDARIIYILRDPMARAVSALRMHILWRFGPDHDTPLQLDDTFFKLMGQARMDGHGSYARNHAAWQRHYNEILVLNYEDFHADRLGSLERVLTFCGLAPERIEGEAREKLDKLLGRRVWESARFPVTREVLLFLQGYTWRTREAVKGVFGMEFSEAERLLAQ
ncbi:MAG: sulfotransferase domain-containing protein [Pararhodobacter sp.]